jgi:hypothetical protein
MIVVALGCKKGVGKTTVARMLADCCGFHVFSFAEALREHCVLKYKFDIALTRTEQGKQTTILHPALPNGMAEVREILQMEGHATRLRDPLYWDRLLFEKIAMMRRHDENLRVVIDDLRHPTEKEGLEQYFQAKCYRIHPFPDWKGGEKHSKHYSEIALDDCIKWQREFFPLQGFEALSYVAQAITKDCLYA